jgi:predicted Zn finger-like uncharacterized protein
VLTQCPNCETTFRVTSEILRVADGQVRCGRCHTQFDALERLINDDGTPARQAFEPRPTPVEIDVQEPAGHEEITLEGRHIEITGTYLVMDESAADGQPQMRQEVVEEWVEIDDEDLQATPEPQQPEAAEDFVDETAATQFEPAESFEQPESEASPEPEPQSEPAPEPEELPPSETPDEDLELLPARTPRRSSLVWKILALPLVLLLAAQAVHHYRAELARHPRLGETVMSIYSRLGLNLTPDWDLHAYQIQHWAVVPDVTTGTLALRASVTNTASFPQPYPLLKLVLEDRWGDTVRAREFEPAEYLDAATSTNRLLAPSQRANVAISIVDPGPDAAGFRFEPCLRGKHGVVCASEVGR